MPPRMTEVYSVEAYYNNRDYVEFLKCADPNVMVMTVPLVNEEEAADIAELFDGLMITGGADLDPALYGKDNHGSTDMYPWEYDSTDLHLYHAFRKAKKPVLGICRGIQVINVAEGGTLIQDLPTFSGLEHNQQNMVPSYTKYEPSHSIFTVRDTVMNELFGDACFVNSFHHQAILECATGFTISAFSQDGVIEAIEKDRVLAVQWHPERLREDAKEIALAKRFLDMVSAQKSEK